MVEKYKLSREVVFTGFVPVSDMPIIYSGAKMFVYPSLYEGFGLPPLEAMACGIPTICSNNSSLPEVVGDGAELVDAENADAISEAMLKISQDEEYGKKLAQRGLARVKQFSWRKTAMETMESYRKALRNN
jgi:glycosyltransferase involved in cell wall biosynthesis